MPDEILHDESDVVTTLLDELTADVRHRLAYVAGLRELAAFVEAHPDLPVPYGGGQNAFVSSKADLAHVARTAGVRWEKSVNGEWFYLRVAFQGGHSYELNIARDQVCRKVVTGTRIEPATPEREVEEVTWVCDEPLLRGAS